MTDDVDVDEDEDEATEADTEVDDEAAVDDEAEEATEGDESGEVASVINLAAHARERSGPGSAQPSEHSQGQNEEGEGEGEAEVSVEPELSMDERIRQRRIAVLRAKGRRRRHRLYWALGIAALVADTAALAHTPLLDVERVEVEGTQVTPPDVVTWASGIRRGAALPTLDAKGAERSIERLAWVDDARIERSWPSTVRIVVKEREPVALVEMPQELGPALVDRDGRVLDITSVDEAVPELIYLTGVSAKLGEGELLPAKARDPLKLAAGLSEHLPGVVAAVSVDFDATLVDGGIVFFGSADRLEEKLLAFETVLSDVDLDCLATVDLRVPTSPALTRGC